MEKFTVTATGTFTFVVELEAESPEHADELTKDFGLEEFQEYGETVNACWNIEIN